MPASGFISQVMPVSVMVQQISAIITGIMPPIIGFIIGIGIMPFIIGFIIGIGIMPFIIGMGIGIIGFIIGIMAGIAVIVVLLARCRAVLARLLPEGVSRFPSAGNRVSRAPALSSASAAGLAGSPESLAA